MLPPFSLYVHIPYCAQRCPYCDFNTYVVEKVPEQEYTAGLISELERRAALPAWKGRAVQSIFFGGGTPSLFEAASLERILSAIRCCFSLTSTCEITLEANPGTVTEDSLRRFSTAGIARVSFGAQSMTPETLVFLGRIHTVQETIDSYHAARRAGFENINLDLMYGIPGQTQEALEADISALLNLAPEHISTYSLTIEKGTPFFLRAERGDFTLPADDSVASMMDLISERLGSAGYEHYEISNFGKPGRASRHNMAYWNNEDYLGLGAGAHSYSAQESTAVSQHGRRWSNYAYPQKYLSELEAGRFAESWSDSLSRESALFEFFFLGLRRSTGVSLAEFEARFGVPLDSLYAIPVTELIRQGCLVREADRLIPTSRGRALLDSMLEHFVAVEPQLEQTEAPTGDSLE